MSKYPPQDPAYPRVEIKRYSNEPQGFIRPRRDPWEQRYQEPPPYSDTRAGAYNEARMPDGRKHDTKTRDVPTPSYSYSYDYPTRGKPAQGKGNSPPPAAPSGYSYSYPIRTNAAGGYTPNRQQIAMDRARSRNMPSPQGVYEPNSPTYQPVSQSEIEQADYDEESDSVFEDTSPGNSRPGSHRSSSRKRTHSAPVSGTNNMGTGNKSPSKSTSNGVKQPSIYHIGSDYVSGVPDIRSTDQDDVGPVKRTNSMQSISSKLFIFLHSLVEASRRTARGNQKLAAITAHASQKFSPSDRKRLATFSSVNYAPTHSQVYKDWLTKHPARISWDRWIIMILIGLAIGLLAALLKQCLTALANLKWDKTKELAREMDLSLCYAWTAGISVIFVIISSVLVAFVHPPAGGSGVPEVSSYLNGVIVHGTMSLKTLIVKFLSLILAVSSGLPAAIQGPIIAMGAIIGLGIGQFKSKTLNISPKWFSRFRTPEERRNFMTAGVAAGVAAAFNAPIGGLLFAQEDLASFWNNRIAWQTFFGCGIATLIANMFNSAFSGFQFKGNFGLLSSTTPDPIPLNVVSLAPAIVLGIVGGLLGALYTRLNTLVIKIRKTIIGAIPHPTAQKFARVLETVIICMIMAATVVWLPSGLPCSSTTQYNQTSVGGCGFGTEAPVEPYTCCADPNNCTEYSEAASIFYAQGLEMWSMLTAKGVHRKFSYETLGYIFLIWYFMLIWTAGSAIAGGTFVPTLVAGALYGRAIGLGILNLYTHQSGHSIPESQYWEWIDPGFCAVLGAGGLLAGVTRKQLAITVIIVEMSQDIDIICPLLLANFVAKMIADLLSKPLHKYQLEAKALPYLDNEVTVVHKGSILNLELYTAKDIMSKPVKVIHVTETMGHLARLLMDTEHGGFPVLRYDEETKQKHLYGLITRTELYVILCHETIHRIDKRNVIVTPDIDYEELSVDYIADQSRAEERVSTYTRFDFYDEIYINLERYINVSSPKVDQNYSLRRTYSLFRTLGLRHLMVTDLHNKVVGIITRKDLMPFHIEECLKNIEPTEESGNLTPILPANKGTSAADSPSGSMHITASDDKNQENNNGFPVYQTLNETPL